MLWSVVACFYFYHTYEVTDRRTNHVSMIFLYFSSHTRHVEFQDTPGLQHHCFDRFLEGLGMLYLIECLGLWFVIRFVFIRYCKTSARQHILIVSIWAFSQSCLHPIAIGQANGTFYWFATGQQKIKEQNILDFRSIWLVPYMVELIFCHVFSWLLTISLRLRKLKSRTPNCCNQNPSQIQASNLWSRWKPGISLDSSLQWQL